MEHRDANVKRALCTRVIEHPFLSKVLFQRLSADVVSPQHPLFRMIQFLEKWEQQELFFKYDLPTCRMRYALGYQDPHSRLGKPHETIVRSTWDKICSLFTIYSLIDVCNRYSGLGPIPKISSLEGNNNVIRERQLHKGMTDKIKIWPHLSVWPTTLRKIRKAFQLREIRSSDLGLPTLAKKYPHIGHVLRLSRSNVVHLVQAVYDNIRMASLGLSWIIGMPGIPENTVVLPDIPDKLKGLLECYQKELECIPDFEKRAMETALFFSGLRAAGVRLPMHLALAISPLCLLSSGTALIHNMKCDRQNLLDAAVALGTERPEPLQEIEREIFSCIFRVTFEPEKLEEAVRELINSDTWSRCERLEMSSEAARFFMPDQGSHIVEMAQEDEASQIAREVNVILEGQDTTMAEVEMENQVAKAIHTSESDHTINEEEEEEMVERMVTNVDLDVQDVTMSVGQRDVAIEDDEPLTGWEGEDQSTKSIHASEDDKSDDMDMEEDEDRALINDGSSGPGDAGEEIEGCRKVLESRKDGEGKIPAISARSSRKRKRKPAQKAAAFLRQEVDNDETEHIDGIDMWKDREVTLDVKEQPAKVAGKPMTVHLPRGGTTNITPYVHSKQTAACLEHIWAAVENGYENGLPLYLSEKRKTASAFCLMTPEEVAGRSDEDFQVTLKTQHIVLLGPIHKREEKSFKRALQDLGAFTTVMAIQDQSLPPEGNQNNIRRKGTFEQLLEASESPKGKVLNALDIPLPGAGFPEKPFASNAAALASRRGDWKTPTPPPMGDVNWALAATAGAFHTWHIDCNGFMTFVSPVCGEKLWIVGRSRRNGDARGGLNDFATGDIFLPPTFQIDSANDELWVPEAILLRPGDTLIMRPNTPHAVFTPKPTVAIGGHCYARATLPDTLVGIIHAFIAGDVVTDTVRHSAQFHLQEMIAFYHSDFVKGEVDDDDPRRAHIPSIENESGHRELLAICIFGLLINVLDFGTYIHPNQLGRMSDVQRREMIEHDVNSLDYPQRMGCMYTRHQSRQILDDIAHHYRMTSSNNKWKDVESYHDAVIVSQCASLLKYKLKANKRAEGAPGCDAELLRTQLLGVAVKGSRLAEQIKLALQDESLSGDVDLVLPYIDSNLEEKEDVDDIEFVNPLLEKRNERDDLYWLYMKAQKCEVEDNVDANVLAKKRKIKCEDE